uniref:HsdS n=1 Tax=Lactococcus lactis subsp. lactis TaxID=1360 RepID=Q9AC97_LACLL|nr:restriction endonuclease subunit S [Lactococcus lactis]AAK38201.1 HsdS [Lactococcus lactis subsp. lactis]
MVGTMAKIDDSVKKKVPELRFPGFTDDWEERKAKEMIKTHHFRSYLAEPNDVGNYEVIQQGDKPIAGYANGEPFEYFYDVTLFGDHTVSLFKPTKPFFIATDGVKIISADEFDGRYFYVTLERYKPASQGYKRHFTILKNEDIWFTTNKDEQVKIGTFFKQLDDTIALHQRKLDLLKEQKKGYLQKMFPKNGAKVPELRFAGFADDWEQRKLKDVTERVRSNDGRMDLPTLTMSASSGWLDQKDRFSGDISGKEKKNYTLLKKGELSYNHGNSKLAKYGVVFSLTNYEEALVPRVYHSFKALENTSADFIEYMFSTKLPDRELGKLVSSGARMDGLLNINYDDFMNIHISIPNYEEQILMSTFFRKLDDTIALHQRKLDLLKEQKKGFLQKMFV